MYKLKKYSVLCLNGSHKGKTVEVVEKYTLEEERLKKQNMSFTVDGIEYAGYCRRCGQAVRKELAVHISNTNYYGKLTVDVFCKYCL